jgi:hypothetical protein
LGSLRVVIARTHPSFTTITPEKLARLIGTANSPAPIDIRTEEDFATDARLIPGVLRRTAEAVADWGKELIATHAWVQNSREGQTMAMC